MSDLLIKGMEMPKRGMVVSIHADRRVTRHFDEFGKMIGKAVPVPPHGRLIDADALVERIEGIWDCNDMVFKPDDHICIPEDCKGCKWRQTKDCIERMVKNAPTIIPAEEDE